MPELPIRALARVGILPCGPPGVPRAPLAEQPHLSAVPAAVCRHRARLGGDPPDFGSSDHQRLVFAALPSRKCFQHKGVYARRGRWNSWHDRAKELSSDWHSWLYGIAVVGITRGWWKALEDTGLVHARQVNFQEPSDRTEDQGPPLDAEPESKEPKTVKESNRRVRSERDRCFNNLHYTAGILADSTVRKLSMVIVALTELVRHQFGEDEIRCKSIQGLLAWWHDETEGIANDHLKLVMAVLHDPSSLFMVGFLAPQDGMPEWYYNDDDDVARKAFSFATALTGQRLQTIGLAAGTLPFAFVRLLHADPDVQAAALGDLCNLFVLIEFYERAAAHDKVLAGALSAMVWLGMVFCRELLVDLAEVGFRLVPSHTRAAIEAFACGMEGTYLIEQLVNYLKGKEGDHVAHQMGKVRRWHFATQSRLLTTFDRPEIRISSENIAAGVADHVLPAGVFNPDAKNRSLDSKLVETIGSSSWTSPSPDAFSKGSYATIAMLECGRDLEKFKMAFLALLFEPGSIVYNKHTKNAFLVVGSFQWGAHLWKVSPKSASGKTAWVKIDSNSDGGQKLCAFQVVTDASMWRAVSVRAVSPGTASKVMGKNMSEHGITLLQDSPPMPLLKFAAKRGFPTMNGFFLGKLARYLSLASSGIVRDVLGRLLQHLLPDMPAEEQERILDKRGCLEGPLDEEDECHSKLLDPKVRDIVSNMIDDDDDREIKTMVETHEVRGAAKAATSRAAPSRSPPPAGAALAPIFDAPAPACPIADAAGSGEAAAVLRRQAVRIPNGLNEGTPAAIKAYMPQVTGCRIFRETAIYHRWIANYPTARPPRSCSKGWLSTGLSEREALLFVLRWCWSRHAEVSGEPCPWDLSE